MLLVSDKTSELCQEILYTGAHTAPQVFLGVEILLCFFIFLLIHNQFAVLKKKFTTYSFSNTTISIYNLTNLGL